MVSAYAKDAYRILGISEGVSPDEIKNAYRTTALKWHPDRHHNRHDKELATRYFAEATNAYRTLVREGYLKYREVPGAINMPELHPVQRPPLMTQKSSSQSSLSLDSFIHLVASSNDSHTTPSSSNRESLRSSWKQGIRVPSETIASQYRNTAPPVSNFHYESPQRGVKGPAMYKPVPVAQSHDHQKRPTEAPKSPSVGLGGGTHQSSSRIPSSIHRHDFHQSQGYPGDHCNLRNSLPPYGLPLKSIGLGRSGEWVYLITLTLEEIFTGKHCHFGITRYYASGRSKNVVMEIDIPAGCRPGTRILCRNVGHEWKPGYFQDIAFVIEESSHDRFIRLFDDLIMEVRVPWVDSLKRQGGKVPFVGIDGRNLVVQIDYPRDKNMKGRSIIEGAGMPIREGGQIVGRGNMVVQWEILPAKTKILHFMKQLWGFGFKR